MTLSRVLKLSRLVIRKTVKKFKRLFKGKYFLNKRIDSLEKNLRHASLLNYGSVVNNLDSKEDFRRHEFKVCSQSGEDGLLLHIFDVIGKTNCQFLEIGGGDGKTCNTANLSINFGWTGHLVECADKSVITARKFYEGKPVEIIKAFVSADGIEKLIEINGIASEIDLLTIDIDGNDYWIWNAINNINPRVVMMEYNGSFGDRPITVKYDQEFIRHQKHESGWYHGASLSALAKLADKKGYALVGCGSNGVNAFFVRRDLINKKLPTMAAQEAYWPHESRTGVMSVEKQFESIKDLPFETIS